MNLIPMGFAAVGIVVFLCAAEFLPVKTSFKRIVQGFVLVVGLAALIAVSRMPV